MKNMGIADLKKKETNMANLTGNAKRKLKMVRVSEVLHSRIHKIHTDSDRQPQ